MIIGEKLSVGGAILTKRIISAKVDVSDGNVRCYIPRSQKIISWVEAHADDIDNRKYGNVKISFNKDTLQVFEEVIHNLN